MKIDKALTIIRSLADGIDPESGEEFDKDSPYNSSSVTRALYTVIEHVERANRYKKRKLSDQEKRDQNIANGDPENAGLPWTEELKTKLSRLHNNGKSIKSLAKHFKRTEGAIIAELKHQGLIDE